MMIKTLMMHDPQLMEHLCIRHIERLMARIDNDVMLKTGR